MVELNIKHESKEQQTRARIYLDKLINKRSKEEYGEWIDCPCKLCHHSFYYKNDEKFYKNFHGEHSKTSTQYTRLFGKIALHIRNSINNNENVFEHLKLSRTIYGKEKTDELVIEHFKKIVKSKCDMEKYFLTKFVDKEIPKNNLKPFYPRVKTNSIKCNEDKIKDILNKMRDEKYKNPEEILREKLGLSPVKNIKIK